MIFCCCKKWFTLKRKLNLLYFGWSALGNSVLFGGGIHISSYSELYTIHFLFIYLFSNCNLLLTGLSSTLFLILQLSIAVDPKWAVMFVASLPSNTTGAKFVVPYQVGGKLVIRIFKIMKYKTRLEKARPKGNFKNCRFIINFSQFANKQLNINFASNFRKIKEILYFLIWIQFYCISMRLLCKN